MRKNPWLFLIVGVFLITGCASGSSDSFFKRTGKEISDPKWTSSSNVKMSFNDIKETIESGKIVTVLDLEYRGFGPETPNVKEVGYLELEKILIGEKGDRSRLPDSIKTCTDKKEKCYGLIVQISSLDTEGQENFLKRMLSGEKKTVARGWKFGAAFAVEREKEHDRVVAAYLRDKDDNVYAKKDEDDAPGAIINAMRPLSIIGGF